MIDLINWLPFTIPLLVVPIIIVMQYKIYAAGQREADRVMALDANGHREEAKRYMRLAAEATWVDHKAMYYKAVQAHYRHAEALDSTQA